jgi:hypothetical protein
MTGGQILYTFGQVGLGVSIYFICAQIGMTMWGAIGNAVLFTVGLSLIAGNPPND